ncbi:PP0621 family protein [Cupriavidus respiraculi]|uniref:MYND finger n=1 Tax=Cupriavidus respiraculi TaxID=195930 RepID=A0ABN7YX42_9BURK|nr:PP0621 family protein [Cupriavidus respiraculi]CAG9176681.1 hypothetical protein LMG21510_03093 [Cupriavidus respiraculi]
MARIFLFLAIAIAILWWLRSRIAARRQADRSAATRGAQPGTPGATQEPMVQCAQCGVHVPAGEAIAFRGLHYCRRSHLPPAGESDDSASGGA